MDKTIFSKKREEYKGDYDEHILEQYKIYMEMADRISQRRMNANTMYITLETALLTFVHIVDFPNIVALFLLHAVEFLVCFSWYYNIKSYRQLNDGKYKVIHEIELYLPLCGYTREWEILGEGKKLKQYWPLTHIEKYLPISYAIIILLSFSLSLFEILCKII